MTLIHSVVQSHLHLWSSWDHRPVPQTQLIGHHYGLWPKGSQAKSLVPWVAMLRRGGASAGWGPSRSHWEKLPLGEIETVLTGPGGVSTKEAVINLSPACSGFLSYHVTPSCHMMYADVTLSVWLILFQ